jgi:hypothetical protein
MARDYLYTVSTMFDKLWAWIMGIITYLASLFGLNRTSTTDGGAKEEVAEAAPEQEEPAPSE